MVSLWFPYGFPCFHGSNHHKPMAYGFFPRQAPRRDLLQLTAARAAAQLIAPADHPAIPAQRGEGLPMSRVKNAMRSVGKKHDCDTLRDTLRYA